MPLGLARYSQVTGDAVQNKGPIDSYTLRGFHWDQVYPATNASGSIMLSLFGFQLSQRVDLFTRKLAVHAEPAADLRSTADRRQDGER